MRRSSLPSFSSKLLAISNPKARPNFVFSGTSSVYYGHERSLYRSQFYSTSASEPSSADSAIKLSPGFSPSAASIDASPLAAASRARDVVDLARHYGRCYWELSKARLSMLVVATSGTGYVLGSGNAIDYMGLCYTCAGTMMVAASANSLNQASWLRSALVNVRGRPKISVLLTKALSFLIHLVFIGKCSLTCFRLLMVPSRVKEKRKIVLVFPVLSNQIVMLSLNLTLKLHQGDSNSHGFELSVVSDKFLNNWIPFACRFYFKVLMSSDFLECKTVTGLVPN